MGSLRPYPAPPRRMCFCMTAAQKTKTPDGQRFPVHWLCRDFNPVLSSASTPPPSQTSRRLWDTEHHCGLGSSTAGSATKRPERRELPVRPARLHRTVTAEYCSELNAGVSRRRFLRRTGLWSDYNPDGETLTLRVTISQGLNAYYSPCLLRIVRRALGQPPRGRSALE